MIEDGTLLKERYKILDGIGEGAIAAVYLALDQRSRDTVAVKVIEADSEKARRFERRFRREASILSELQDPHIVRVFDFGVDGPVVFIVMEFVPGRTVADIIRKEGALEVEDALDIVRQVAEGLQSTSQANIVHRDLKPQNLKLTPEGRVKIMDFGISCTAGGLKLSETGFLGTPYYISPEQAESSTLDVRSDIYSLGVVLFEMLTGKVLFDGNSPLEIALKHARKPIPPLQSYRADFPTEVEAILKRCLAKEPSHRFQTPRDLIRAIDSVPRRRSLGKRKAGAHPAEVVERVALIAHSGRQYMIHRTPARIGRKDAKIGVDPDIDLTPERYGRTVSRRHAIIDRRHGQWCITEEPGAKLGTFVNRQRLSPGRRMSLKDGDEVRFGRTKLTFRVSRSSDGNRAYQNQKLE